VADVRFTDAAGNATTVRISVIVEAADTTAPVISTGNLNPSVVQGSTAVATLTANESVTWSALALDGTTSPDIFINATTGAVTMRAGIAPGVYLVDVAATDAAGNQSIRLLTVTVTSGSGSGSSNVSTPTIPAPNFQGPLASGRATISPQGSGSLATLNGTGFDGVSKAMIRDQEVEIISSTPNRLTLKLPVGLAVGSCDLVLTTGSGTITLQGVIVILASAAEPFAASQGTWTKAVANELGSPRVVKMYAKNPIAKGKIQFFNNGKEIAWIRAVDETDPKLRSVGTGVMAGSNYLVRSINLVPGKNALEIFIDGKRVWRAAYSLN
jgi:hypothetical protein